MTVSPNTTTPMPTSLPTARPYPGPPVVQEVRMGVVGWAAIAVHVAVVVALLVAVGLNAELRVLLAFAGGSLASFGWSLWARSAALDRAGR